MRKIGVFGGTFNPIHNGHINMALGFTQALGLDKVLLIPANIPPHKVYEDKTPAKARLEMCRIAAKQCPLFEASDIELRRKGKSYTVDTLRELTLLYPGSALYLITGADMFLTVQDWKDADEIFALATICAAPRDAFHFSILQNHADGLKWEKARARILDIPLTNISSTAIRDMVKKGEDISSLVPPGVDGYILAHHLYKE